MNENNAVSYAGIMSKIQEFENAPVGATATNDTGSRAMKVDDVRLRWALQNGDYLLDEGMVNRGYTLDPVAPTNSEEALDMAWELGHEVKEGQVIPEGMRYIRRYQRGDLATFISSESWTPRHIDKVRTRDPIPEPKPDWLDAPAVLARHKDWDKKYDPRVFERTSNGLWVWDHFVRAEAWDLRDVTPLYPKG